MRCVDASLTTFRNTLRSSRSPRCSEVLPKHVRTCGTLHRVHRTLLIAAFLLLSFRPMRGSEGTFRVTLLGTGTPRPTMNRFGPSILIEAGAEVLLFDVGRGSLQ